MKVMTIYELLGLIKDGKAPDKIKLNGVIFEYTGDDYLYKDNNEEHWLFSTGYTDKYMWLNNFLNAEIEIIEDTPKKIEKLDINDDNSLGLMINGHFDRDSKELIMAKKLNEIIDYINKGDSNE